MRTIFNLITSTLLLLSGLSLFSQGPYCKPYSECQQTYQRDVWGNSQLSIVDIEFDTQFNNPSAYNKDNCIDNGYQDFSADKKGVVEQNREYDLIVYAEPYSHQYSSTGYMCHVWCDWDMDFEFEDSELTIIPADQVGAFSTFNLFFQGKIAVPGNANIGETRMRVRVYHSSDLPEPASGTRFLEAVPDTMPGPCDTTRTGETEDYGLLVYSVAPTPTEYCSASGPKDCRGSRLDLDGGSLPTKYEWHYIDTVRIAGENGTGITNVSTLNDCRNFKSYGDYTKKYKYPPSWIPGEQYEVYVTRADDNSDELPVSCGVWIDWNNDFDFEDPDESFMDFRTFQVDSQTRYHPFNIIVPPNVTEGRKRMRIRTTVAQSTPRACGDKFNNGEVEDYEIFVSATGDSATFLACIPDSTASPNNTNTICQRDPQFRWGMPAAGDPATGFNFYLGTNPEADNVFDKLDVGPNLGYNYTGKLLPNTIYYWRAVPYNATGEANEVCSTWTFRTAAKKDPLIDMDGPDLVLDTAILCPGFGTTVTAIVDGGNGTLTYSWGGNGGYIVGGAGNNNFIDYFSSNQTQQDFTVRVTDDFGCYGDADVHIITKEPANAGVLNGLGSVCKYSNISLNLTGTRGKLQWQVYDSNKKIWKNLEGETSTDITFENIRWPMTYRVYASLAGCGDTLAPFTVSNYNIPPAPRISSSIGANLCGGDTALLTSSSNDINVWSTGDTAQFIKTATHGLYSVYYVNANGCNSDTASFQIIDYPDPPKPIIYTTDNFEFCINDSIVITADANGADFYWNGKTKDRNKAFTVTELGKYYVTSVNAGGCTVTSDTATVTINPLPEKKTITSSTGNFEFCEGASVNLLISSNDEVYWMADDNNKAGLFKVSENGFYFAKLVSNKGCINYSDTVEVVSTKNPIKPILKALTPQEKYCYYENTKLYVQDNFSSIYWNGNTQITADTILAEIKGNYFVTAQNDKGCKTNSEDFFVNILDTMYIPEVKISYDSLYVEVPNDYTMQWYLDGLALPVVNIHYLIPDVDGQFSVRVVDANGCESYSEPFDFTYGQGTSIDENEMVKLRIAPNPVNVGDIIRIIVDEKISTIRLIEQTGKEILRAEQSSELQCKGISSGVYFLQVIFENEELAPVTRTIVLK